MAEDTPAQAPQRPIPVIVHLSGKLRGTTHRLYGERLRIGTAPDAEIHFPVDLEPAVSDHHAVLERRGDTWTLHVEDGGDVWVNGERTTAAELRTGDLLEIGPSGPILRFRLYPRDSTAHKSMGEAFSDCLDCARNGADGPIGRAGIFLRELPRELATETSPRTRSGAAIVVVLLLISVAFLLQRSEEIGEKLQEQSRQVEGIAELVELAEASALKPEDLERVRTEIQQSVTSTLDERAGAGRRVISEASRSVIFLQGAYGFETPDGQPLRLVVGPDGRPVTDSRGNPQITPGGDGPLLQAFYTGTAFVSTDDGLLLTNRHVAEPWRFEPAARRLADQGLVPTMQRFVGYLPELAEPFDVDLVVASEHADLAVLRCSDVTRHAPTLELREEPMTAGDEVLVLGFPTGIQALLARADEAFVNSLASDGTLDFWTVAERLAREGHIAPLASRGIVGQVTAAYVVYDAETTSGGSGGPVLDLDGKVAAINAAILPQFGGSNMGVPAAEARKLLERAAAMAAPEVEPPAVAAEAEAPADPETP